MKALLAVLVIILSACEVSGWVSEEIRVIGLLESESCKARLYLVEYVELGGARGTWCGYLLAPGELPPMTVKVRAFRN